MLPCCQVFQYPAIDIDSFDVESNFNNILMILCFCMVLITIKRFGSRLCEAGEGDCSRDSDCKGSLVRYNAKTFTWHNLGGSFLLSITVSRSLL